MITFETQEEFEDAVMQVLHKRLVIVLYKDSEDDLTVALKDGHDCHNDISRAWDI